MRIAIIGANGQIGRRLAVDLRRHQELEPIALCRNEFSAGALRLLGCQVRTGTLGEGDDPLLGDCAAIVNCALPLGLPDATRRQDRLIAANLRRWAARAHVIHLSSVAVYRPFSTEARPRRPRTSYGLRKLAMERMLKQSPGRAITVLRLGHVYGPGQWMSQFVCERAEAAEAALPFGGDRPSYAVHVRNVAAAVRSVVSAGIFGTYDVYDNPNLTWRSLFDWHCRALGMNPPPPMPPEASAQWEALAAGAYSSTAARATRELLRWLRALPASYLASAPTAREILDRILTLFPNLGLGPSILARYRCSQAGAARLSPGWRPDEYLMWRFNPQRLLNYNPELDASDEALLRQWHEARSNPD